MIYLKNITTPQAVPIPLEEPWTMPTDDPSTWWYLDIFDTFRLVTLPINNLISGGDWSEFAHYALAEITLMDGEEPVELPEGSYEYRFHTATGKILSSGCCQVGEYVPQVTKYNQSIEYDPYTL